MSEQFPYNLCQCRNVVNVIQHCKAEQKYESISYLQYSKDFANININLSQLTFTPHMAHYYCHKSPYIMRLGYKDLKKKKNLAFIMVSADEYLLVLCLFITSNLWWVVRFYIIQSTYSGLKHTAAWLLSFLDLTFATVWSIHQSKFSSSVCSIESGFFSAFKKKKHWKLAVWGRNEISVRTLGQNDIRNTAKALLISTRHMMCMWYHSVIYLFIYFILKATKTINVTSQLLEPLFFKAERVVC